MSAQFQTCAAKSTRLSWHQPHVDLHWAGRGQQASRHHQERVACAQLHVVCHLPCCPLLRVLQAGSGGGPAALLSGAGPLNVRGSLQGSHLAPTTRVDWAAPSSGLSGTASLTPTALALASSGPGFKLRASAVTSNPTADEARAANTQVGQQHTSPAQRGLASRGGNAGQCVHVLHCACCPFFSGDLLPLLRLRCGCAASVWA